MKHDRSKPKKFTKLFGFTTAAALLLAACGSASNEGERDDQVLTGEQIEMVIGYAPGGSYDQWARAMQPYIDRNTGAKTVVRNTPGAGGLLAMSNIYNASEGSVVIGNVNVPGVVGPILAGAPGVNFALDEFHWIGNSSGEPEVMILAADNPIKSFEELIEEAKETQIPVKFGAPGPDNFYLDALVLSEIFDFPIEVVTGYDGVGGVFNAVIQGDLDAAVGTLTTSQSVVQAGEAMAVVTIGDLPEGMSAEDIGDIMGGPVPEVQDLYDDFGEHSDISAEILETHLKVLRVGRPLVAAPSTNEAQLDALRAAYDTMVADPGYFDEMKKQNLFPKAMDHEQVEELMQDLLNAPDSYAELVKAAYTE